MPSVKTHSRSLNGPSSVKKTVAPATRAARLRKLRTLTREEYFQMLHTVEAIVPSQYCDPEDALHQGLLLAFAKFEGWGELSAFVARCAFLYALQQAQRRHRLVTFSQLQAGLDGDEEVEDLLPSLEDPRYVEAIDEHFVGRIEDILARSYDRRLPYGSHRSLQNATRMLTVLRENANLGQGVGIDEYEDTPPAMVHRPGKPTHDTKLVRGLILDHLRDALDVDRNAASHALTALRISTRQALHEGWLPC